LPPGKAALRVSTSGEEGGGFLEAPDDAEASRRQARQEVDDRIVPVAAAEKEQGGEDGDGDDQDGDGDDQDDDEDGITLRPKGEKVPGKCWGRRWR